MSRRRRESYLPPTVADATPGEQLGFVLGLSLIAVLLAAVLLVGLS